MASHFIPSLIVLIVALALRVPESQCDSRVDIVSRTCTNATVRDDADYKKSYNRNLDQIQEGMQNSKFGSQSDGHPPQRQFVLSQCMADLNDTECKLCWAHAADILASCFPATGGRVYLDGCFARADNYSFFKEIVSDKDLKICGRDTHPAPEYRFLLSEVIGEIINKAPKNAGFATTQKSDHGQTIYGLGICWKTLDKKACGLCLRDASVSAFKCLPSNEGRVLNAGCFLRYSDYEFYNNREMMEVLDEAVTYVFDILAMIAIGILAIAVGFCAGKCTYLQKHKGSTEMDSKAIYGGMHSLRFKYSTLQNATNDFNEAHKLGNGGYGEVFKGTLPDGREIAIKRLLVKGEKAHEDIQNEIDVICRCQHKNLVRFLGCCFTNMNGFLVYEFVTNMSLDRVLFGKEDPERKQVLDWQERLRIILGTANGLMYLHRDCQIVHRDIKASNILLDWRYRPRISDFGLATFCSLSSNGCYTDAAIVGTLGYMAPEYMARGQITDKTDVYSFGVLVLEIVSGVQNNKFHSDDTFETLVTHAWKCFNSDRVEEIIDKSMVIMDVEEVKRTVHIGLLCTQESPYLRPSMAIVLGMFIEKDKELPRPDKPPFTDESTDIVPQLGVNRTCTDTHTGTEMYRL